MKWNLTVFLLLAGLGISQGTLFGAPDFSKFSEQDFKHLGEYGNQDFPVTLTCNQVLFSSCLSQYYANAGLVGPFNNPNALGRAIQNKINSQGTNGIIQICNAGSLFAQCMTPQMAALCINPLTQIRNGMSLNNAIGFAVIYYQLHVGCGGGLMTFLYNWPCIRQTSIAQNASIVQCGNTFAKQITNDIAHYCKYAQQLMQCIANIFNAPTCNSATGWLQCEFTRIAVTVPVPLCPLRCIVQRSSSGETVVAEIIQPKQTEQAVSEPRESQEIPPLSGETIQKGMEGFLGNSYKHLQDIALMAQKQEEKDAEKMKKD